jgi:prophage regulatory protein
MESHQNLPVDVLLRLPRVKAVTGLSRSTLYALIAQSKFPPPIRISERAVAWPASAVHEWIEARISQGRKAT